MCQAPRYREVLVLEGTRCRSRKAISVATSLRLSNVLPGPWCPSVSLTLSSTGALPVFAARTLDTHFAGSQTFTLGDKGEGFNKSRQRDGGGGGRVIITHGRS